MLPIELWTHICSFACLDDGFTARSLSKASHLLRDAAEPFRWRTIAVNNVRQLINLTTLLESSTRNVEFLYVNATFLTDEDQCILVEFYRPGLCDRIPGPGPEDILDSQEELVLHAISRLLTAVRTTARIAHIRSDYRDCVFYPVKFDRLEELTLEGSFDSTYRDYIASLPANPTICRLKFNNAELNSSGTLLDSIVAYAPRATHLYCRLRSVQTFHSATAELPVLLSPSSEVARSRVFPSLEKLYIHPGRSEPPGFCATGSYLSYRAKRALYDFSRIPALQSRVVVLKQERYDSERDDLQEEEAKEEWLDRIHGGLGCWDDSDRMDSAF